MRDEAAAAQSPLAERLFDIDGVCRRLLRLGLHLRHQGGRRVAAAQAGDPRRHHGALHVRRAARASPTAPPRTTARDEFFEAKDTETVATIKELIETRVRPAVANDGGDITFRGFKDGVVYLRHEGRLLRLPVVDRDAAPRHPEPAAALRARRGRGPADLALQRLAVGLLRRSGPQLRASVRFMASTQ